MNVMPNRGRIMLALPAALFCLVLPRSAAAQCQHEAQRTAAAPTSGVERVVVIAGSGSLEVTGRAGVTQAVARGRACASDADRLREIDIDVRREGSTLVIEALYPDESFRMGNRYARLDLTVHVPEELSLRVEDGSGDASISGVGETRVDDGSGNLAVRDIGGSLTVEDGSGNLEIAGIAGDVEVDDGSGDIRMSDVRGAVRIGDGSGNMRIRGVGGSVRVEDGSGEIRIAEVTRDVLIDDDGSGSIRVDGVGGNFTVDDDGSGGVSYDAVQGRVSVPRDD